MRLNTSTRTVCSRIGGARRHRSRLLTTSHEPVPDLLAVDKHYDATFHLGLSARQENDLVQYLLSL